MITLPSLAYREARYCLGFIYNLNMTEVVLQLKDRSWQKGKWNGIGGKLQPGEDAREGMHREFNEELETSLGPKKLPWAEGPTLDFPNNDAVVYTFYVAVNDTLFYGLRAKGTEQLTHRRTTSLPDYDKLVSHVAWLVQYLRELTQYPVIIQIDH